NVDRAAAYGTWIHARRLPGRSRSGLDADAQRRSQTPRRLRSSRTRHQTDEVMVMGIIDSMLSELDEEAKTTRRVLERVPGNQLAWRPHEKARTLGELALHVAMVPGGVAQLVSSPSPAQAPNFIDVSPKSAAELVPSLDDSIAKAKKALGGMDDAAAMEPWTLMAGSRKILTVPRAVMLRSG